MNSTPTYVPPGTWKLDFNKFCIALYAQWARFFILIAFWFFVSFLLQVAPKAADPSVAGAPDFPFSDKAYATDFEVELLSHLMVYRVYDNTVLMDQLFALCELIIFDSPKDYEFLSPSPKGIWKIPPSWSNQTIINKV
jgi:hypothetical protein